MRWFGVGLCAPFPRNQSLHFSILSLGRGPERLFTVQKKRHPIAASTKISGLHQVKSGLTRTGESIDDLSVAAWFGRQALCVSTVICLLPDKFSRFHPYWPNVPKVDWEWRLFMTDSQGVQSWNASPAHQTPGLPSAST